MALPSAAQVSGLRPPLAWPSQVAHLAGGSQKAPPQFLCVDARGWGAELEN